MSSRLLDVTVHPDWQEIDRLQAARAARAWRGILVALIAAVLVSMLLNWLAPNWTGLLAVRVTIFTLVTWLPPMWYLMYQARGRGPAILPLAGVLSLLTIAAIVAAATAPVAATGAVAATTPMIGPLRLPLPFVLLVPATTWSLLLYRGRRAPAAFRGLGFVAGGWFYYGLAGAAAGAALGFHLLLITRFLPLPAPAFLASPAAVLWSVCYVVGLRATGEELLFRGLGYHLLAGSAETILAVVLRILTANLFLHLMGVSYAAYHALWLLSLGYTALLAVATTLLRYRSGSLIPSLACDVVFTLFVTAVLPW